MIPSATLESCVDTGDHLAIDPRILGQYRLTVVFAIFTRTG
ncbi:MAG: hypothetical protein ACLQMT_12130 [Candidatus Acidiferrales bacterium]